MTLERANIRKVHSLLVERLNLRLLLSKLALELLDLLRHLSHLVSYPVGRLTNYLVDVYLGADALRLAAEVKRLERLLHIRRRLRDAADDRRL